MSNLDLSALMDDGDKIELPDGRTLRLLIKPDDISVVDNFDEFHGKLAPVHRSRTTGYDIRPAGFDGNAEKLWASRSDQVWWQPPAEGPKRGTPEFERYRRYVLDLLENGYCGVVLEVLDGKDAYGRPIVTHTASLWAIDSLENGYLAEVVGELAAELGLTDDDKPPTNGQGPRWGRWLRRAATWTLRRLRAPWGPSLATMAQEVG